MERMMRIGLVRVLLTSLMAGALASCGSVTLHGEPQEIRLEVDADGVTNLTLVSSTRFVFVNDPGCDTSQNQNCEQVLQVLQADTTQITAPYDHTYLFTTNYRYLFEVYPTDEIAATVYMHVQVDGKDWYDESRPLQITNATGGRDSILFTYLFSKPTL